jgi:TonB-dependent starch-binding outer membrane protein SusC
MKKSIIQCLISCKKPAIKVFKLMSFFILFLPLIIFAQKPVTVTGVVRNGEGIPMKGVTITVQATKKATVTDEDGKYKIELPSQKSLLIFTTVGFETQERGIGPKAILDITLKEIVSSLNDVIVIGYGTAKRKDLISSVGKANVEDMKKAPVISFDQMLAGRVAGVNVTSSDGQPGGAATITIRGASVSQETSPLYVIDGFPIENIDINSINPNQIESLEILKDPSAVAIYGSRGANGVILITTKRGKPGPPTVTYNFSYGIQKDTRRIEMMSPYEFVKLQLELDSIASTPTLPSNRFRQIYIDPTKGVDLNYYKTQKGLDWQDLVLQKGVQQSHSINVSGGNKDTRYSFSGGYFNQTGIVINTGIKRYDYKFSIDQKLSDHFRTGASIIYANTNSYGTLAVGGATGGVIQGIWQYRPTTGLSNQDIVNNLVDSIALQDFFSGAATNLGDNLVNPLQQAENEKRESITKTTYVSTYLEYSFFKNFKLRLSGGYNSTDLTLNEFYNSKTLQGLTFKNSAGSVSNVNGINGRVSNSAAQTFSSSNTLSFNKLVNQHHKIDVLAGFEYNYGKQQSTRLAAINIPQATEYLGLLSLGTGTPSVAGIPAGTRNQTYSVFARGNYNFASKYYIMAAMRVDGSSRFAPGKQWGYFPSGGVAWTLSEEKFFKKLKPVISFAKLRFSYGNTGNNRVGDFSYLSQYGSLTPGTGYVWNNVNVAGVNPFFYGNDDLTWETTTGLDYGINLEFLKGKISLEAVYYTKNTKDFLLGVRLPFSAGYPNGANAQYQNTGEIRNSGFEFTLNTDNIKKKNFSWSTSFNISFNKSEIKKFYNGLESIQTGFNLPGNSTAWITKVGGPLSAFYGYQWGGVYQYTDFDRLANGTYVVKNGIPTYAANVQPGDPKYKDLNGDGVVDANDQTTLGSPLPIHTGGISNNFTYKNWSLNVFMQWSYGNEILNANRIVFESNGGYALNYNQFATYANRWTPTNPTNDIPRARYNLKGDAGSANPRPSSRVIEDGSFLRLKTVSLGYDLPASYLRKIKIKNIRLSAAAQNLFTWTKYSGVDPEVSTFRTNNASNTPFGGTALGSTSVSGAGYTFIQPSSGYGALAGGYDYTPYPRAITLTFAVNVTF